MTGTVLEVQDLAPRDWLATHIAHLYQEWNGLRLTKIGEWK